MMHCQFAFSNSEKYAEIKHVLKLAFNLSVFSNLISKSQVKDVMFLVQGHFEK
jgi:inosine/xanthosine triphosphate pyrophosphatase family protein